MKKTIALSAMTAMALSGLAYSEIESEFTVSYNTDYIFRSANFGDDLYTYGFDVAGSCDCGFDWSAGIWYAEIDGPPAGFTDEELDIYGEVSKDFGFGTIGLGFVRYIFPDDDNVDGADADTTELYLSYGTSAYGLDLGAIAYLDVDAFASNFYGELSVAYGHDFTENISGELGVNVGFFDDGYAQTTVTLGLSIAVSEEISVNPYIAYSDTGSDYDDFLGGIGSDSQLYGGVSVGFSF